MVDEFACPHCGKNLGPSQSSVNTTLMCPYCQQFFTMAGGVEKSVPEVKPPESRPVEKKYGDVGGSKVESAKTDGGDLGSGFQARRAPEIVEPPSEVEILTDDKTSRSTPSAPPSDVGGRVGGESDTLKAIGQEDRLTESLSPMAEIMASRDREPVEIERTSPMPAPA
ncbi:MAG: hypothetical protein GY869_16335, partial [Planctomycetes bacterium]|nr:hypothetical protein [Planctomycetota bacterium]